MTKVVCFDFDDVLADKGSVKRFMQLFGHTFKELEYGIELLEDNKNPKKFFRTAKKVVMLGKGLKYSRVEKIFKLLKPNKNARNALAALKKRGFKIVIVSVNDINIIRNFLKKNGLRGYVDHIYAGKLETQNGLLTGIMSGDAIRTEKVGVVKCIEKRFGAKKKDIFYIGDGLTDLPIIKRVGKGVLFCPNALTMAEVFTDKALKGMVDSSKLFLVKEKDLMNVLDFIK